MIKEETLIQHLEKLKSQCKLGAELLAKTKKQRAHFEAQWVAYDTLLFHIENGVLSEEKQ